MEEVLIRLDSIAPASPLHLAWQGAWHGVYRKNFGPSNIIYRLLFFYVHIQQWMERHHGLYLLSTSLWVMYLIYKSGLRTYIIYGPRSFYQLTLEICVF